MKNLVLKSVILLSISFGIFSGNLAIAKNSDSKASVTKEFNAAACARTGLLCQ
jgi:hypothetical protein